MKLRLGWLGSFLIVLVVVAVAYHSSRFSPKAETETSHEYEARGTVEQISPDHHQVTIHHEAIPGYMMEMTMDFPVADGAEVENLSPGDKIAFTLVIDQDHSQVKNFRRLGHDDTVGAAKLSHANDGLDLKLKPGDPIPDAELLTEDGRSIRVSSFRGQVVAFTFFFTRCPVPDYCPRMNRNFEQTRQLLLASPKAAPNWEFLSISFDSTFDGPEVLSSYAGFYRNHNADRWLFASASPREIANLAAPLGLMIMGQDGNLSHNLRTVVMDPQGRLYRQFNNNSWTPQQLADAMLEAAHSTGSR